MAPINFDTLPDSISAPTVPKGHYYATIEKAEIKTGKDASKPPYLNMMFKLQNGAGEPVGTMWDIISENTNDYARYKLKRFIIALGVPITPNMSLELKDLVKIDFKNLKTLNKSLIVNVLILVFSFIIPYVLLRTMIVKQETTFFEGVYLNHFLSNLDSRTLPVPTCNGWLI